MHRFCSGSLKDYFYIIGVPLFVAKQPEWSDTRLAKISEFSLTILVTIEKLVTLTENPLVIFLEINGNFPEY